MTPSAQANYCWNLLTKMMTDAIMQIRYVEGNEHTSITPGLTTIVARKDKS